MERIRNLDSRVRSYSPFRFVCDHVQFTCDHVQFTATAARVLRSRPQSPPLSSSAATRPPWCLARSHRLFLHRLHALSVPRRRLCSSVSLTHSSFTDAGWQEPLGPEVTCDWMATGHVNIDDDLPALVREHETPNEREKEQWIFPVASSCNYVARG